MNLNSQRWRRYSDGVFNRPQDEADIVRMTTFSAFYRPSEVRIAFVDDRLVHVGIFAALVEPPKQR